MRRVEGDKIDLNFQVKLPNVLRKKGVYTTVVTITTPSGDIYTDKDSINLVVYPHITRKRKK